MLNTLHVFAVCLCNSLFSFYPVHSAGSKLVLSCCRRCVMCGCLGCPAFALPVSTSDFCVMRLPPFVCDVLVYRLAMGCFAVPAFSNGYRLDGRSCLCVLHDC
ncbi:hypothetical protein BDV38DRAFT_61892 [Aspergillus pseudotamarii]|uniref:4Fe-4S ferredoxin-type domain-containing protein n=1 Tax=Aspergillus pseudotamarii TaxID=132259 RepID=A0A5N6T9W3_ASPPS|nr:uncharacterized protein BDV38DRAFT_61892 [Aspergillus pseudotamarii]KAE8143135.1 hypothetical protein BDV38DRAFT_61892 [Aspergillus pseudotamarii]